MIFHNSEFDFRRQECTKIRSKIASKMAWLKFAAKTLQDASKTLTRRPKKLSDLPQDAPQTPQDASKTTPRRPKDGLQAVQDAPKAPPRRLQEAPRRLQDLILMDFWKPYGDKLAPKPHPAPILCESSVRAQNIIFVRPGAFFTCSTCREIFIKIGHIIPSN